MSSAQSPGVSDNDIIFSVKYGTLIISPVAHPQRLLAPDQDREVSRRKCGSGTCLDSDPVPT